MSERINELKHNVRKTRAFMRDSYFSHKVPMKAAGWSTVMVQHVSTELVNLKLNLKQVDSK